MRRPGSGDIYYFCTRFDVDLFRFGDQSLFVNAHLFEQAGGFRSDYYALEGHDMVKRLKGAALFMISPQKITVSARKYRANGAIRLQFIYGAILILYKCGLAQQKLYDLLKRWVH